MRNGLALALMTASKAFLPVLLLTGCALRSCAAQCDMSGGICESSAGLVDFSDLPPSARGLGLEASRLLATYRDRVYGLLGRSDDGRRISVHFGKLDGPARTSGREITLSADRFIDDPRDMGGVLTHELAHVAQAYPAPSKESWWIIEGIADYARWRVYPDRAWRPGCRDERYESGYGCAAAFLRYLELVCDPGVVKTLDQATRTGRPLKLDEAIHCGRDSEALWSDCMTGFCRYPAVFDPAEGVRQDAVGTEDAGVWTGNEP